MAKNERITDFFIGNLLRDAEIEFVPNGSSIKEIQDALKFASKKGTGNIGFPEFTAKSKDFILVIENKANIENQGSYEDVEQTVISTDVKSITNFAENGALHYAQQIISRTAFKKVFAFGCTGNEKHHHIRPIYVDAFGYKALRPVDNFENFSVSNIERYYNEQVLGKIPPEVLEAEEIIKKAKELHEYLRNYGQLGDDEKPLVVSAIMLALSDDNFRTDSLTGDKVRTDGQKIFTAVEDYMKRVEVTPTTKKEKVLNQFILVKDRTLLNTVDERLAKTPLRYFTEFLETNVLSSVKTNTKEDILGMFYGEFIRFSGGDGQTLGVVLTPSHITELFCDLVDLKATDKVFDPCCGTSGFLIAALHKMLLQVDSKDAEINIKKNLLHGIEIREDMFSIATTNMILRGDGKSNLENADFLKQPIDALRANSFTVGFMNPPYSQAKGKDTAHLSEIHFIEHLLNSLANGARCVVIVPQSTMVGKTKESKLIKKRLLLNHTLEGVITLNKETFYGIGTNPCLAIFTAHKPHSSNKYCKFINFEDDGFTIRKHIGLVETERAKERKAHLLNVWLHDAPAESRFMVKSTIEPEDEWLHSYFYFNDEKPKPQEFEKTITDFLTFEFSLITKGLSHVLEPYKIYEKIERKESIAELFEKEWDEFYLKDIFPEIQRGKRLKKGYHISGQIPYVSSTSMNNGIDGFIGNIENVRMFSNCLTIANSGSVGATFFQPMKFVASDHVTKLKNPNFNKYIYLFLATITSRLSEKYSFNREINDPRIKREKIVLPVNERAEPDYSYMENYMKRLEYNKLNFYVKLKGNSIID